MAFLNSDFGIGLPVTRRTNNDISQNFPEWDADKIYNKIGISNRFICLDDQNSLDLAKKSFENLLEKRPDLSIDLVIYVSNSSKAQAPGDGHKFISFFPILNSCGCLDINLGCSGFTYALGVANSLIDSNCAKNILVITTDAYSKYIGENDKGNMTLFGDGSAASLVSRNPISNFSWKISDFKFGAQGNGYEDLVIHKKFNNKDLSSAELYMNGQKIFKFTSTTVYKFIKNQNIDLNNYKIIFHQANAFMLNYMRKKLDINDENFIISFEKTGNTVSASIPLAMNNNLNEIVNQSIFLCGFGIGASYSSIILNPN